MYTNLFKKSASILLALIIIFSASFIYAESAHADTVKTVRVKLRMNMTAGMPAEMSEIDVRSDEAENAGIRKNGAPVSEDVEMADVAVAVHKIKCGEDAFNASPSDYLIISDEGFTEKVFGIENGLYSFRLNHMGSAFFDVKVNDGDLISVQKTLDENEYTDRYLFFSQLSADEKGNITAELKMTQYNDNYEEVKVPAKDIQISYDLNGEELSGVTDENGLSTIKASKSGEYSVSVKAANPYDALPAAEKVNVQVPEGQNPEVDPSAPEAKPVLLARLDAKGRNGLKMTWTKVRNASGYDIFLVRCIRGETEGKLKKIKTVKGNKTFSLTKSGLSKGAHYKFRVKAYRMKNGKKSYVSTSMVYHAVTNGNRTYTNAKDLKLKKNAISLKPGETYTVRGNKSIKVNAKKRLIKTKHAPYYRYQSLNSRVATVDGSGKITAKAKGSCTIYVIAQNGVKKGIKVSVK